MGRAQQQRVAVGGPLQQAVAAHGAARAAQVLDDDGLVQGLGQSGGEGSGDEIGSPSGRVGDHDAGLRRRLRGGGRSEEHTSELQSLMRISYAVFCLKKKKHTTM